MARLLTRLLPLVLALFAFAANAYAASPDFTGDAFRKVVPLAGSWHLTADALTPAEAEAAEITRWSTVQVPGKWDVADVQKAGAGWCAIDIQLPPVDARAPGAPELALALPPFLYAFEVYANGELVGQAGRGTPPSAWAPFRDQAFPLPPRVVADDGLVRLRIHVRNYPGYFRMGSHSMGDAAGVAVGPRPAVAQLLELLQARAELYAPVPFERGMPFVFVGMAFVFLMLFALTPARREYAYYALLLAVASTRDWSVHHLASGKADDPLPYYLFVAFTASVTSLAWLLLIRRLFQLEGWLPRLLTALTALWTALGAAVWAAGRFHPAIEVAARCGALIIFVYTFLAVVRRARRRFPDARLLVGGFAIFIVLAVAWIAYPFIFPVSARGQRVVVVGWVALLSNMLMLGLMALVLARRYRRSLDDLGRSYDASIRFVPQAFLELLGRKNVTEVERGDRTHRDMTVLFCDIRGFTTLAERVGPEETIAFLNRYLLAIEPAVVEHGGFINQYYGDGIMALFPSAEEAVTGALALVRAVDAFNDEEASQGHPPVQIGVGLNAGDLAMGTIGGEVRLDSGVVGDAVNTAARIEGMTKMYATRVLVGESVVQRLNEESGHALREVDRVVAKGKHQALTIYEMVAAEPDALREAKLATLEDFRRGLELARAGDIDEAQPHFAACLERNEDDRGAALWLARCDAWGRDGLPAEPGITVLDRK